MLYIKEIIEEDGENEEDVVILVSDTESEGYVEEYTRGMLDEKSKTAFIYGYSKKRLRAFGNTIEVFKSIDVELARLKLLGSACEVKYTSEYGYVLLKGDENAKVFVVPDFITIIGDRAFKDCRRLTSVNIPNTVKHIGTEAFRDCSSLKEVKMSNLVRTIYRNAFSRCSALEAINLPSTLEYLGAEAFCKCVSLEEVRLPENIELRPNVFKGCSGLKSVYFPKKLTGFKEALSSSSLFDAYISSDSMAYEWVSKHYKFTLV